MRKVFIFCIVFLCSYSASTKAQNAGIVISPGTTFTSSAGSFITIGGNWSNGGTFSPGTGTVIFNGTSGDQSVTNSSGETFGNITINKSSGNLVLQNNITANGTITLTTGDVDLNSRTINLGSSALLSESAGNTIKGSGSLTGSINLNAPSAVNVFGLGAVITLASNMGSTTISRGHSQQTGNSNTSILRYYDIIPTNNAGLNASLVFNYDESELNGKDESSLILFKSTNSGTDWTLEGGTANSGSNNVSLSGINSFSRWTLAPLALPLPVELISFTAISSRSDITLKWETSTEINFYGFYIERKEINLNNGFADNQEFINAGFVKGSGNSNSVKNYEFIDKNLSAGKYLYRLKQIDNNGTFKYSDVIDVQVEGAPLEFKLAQNYPNPFNPETLIEFTVPETGIANLSIYNSLGEKTEELYNGIAEAGKYNHVRFNGSSLASGTYIARLQFGNKQVMKKMLLLK